VGDEWQADVPENICPYEHNAPYEDEDILVWDPKRLPEKNVEQYLLSVISTEHHRFSLIRDRCIRLIKQHQIDQEGQQQPSSSTPEQDSNSNLPVLIPDDEYALFILLHCENIEEAIKRTLTAPNSSESIFCLFHTNWSDQEVECFEEGLCLFGKDFHAIQKNNMTIRTVREIVHFYYKWKKTERYKPFVLANGIAAWKRYLKTGNCLDEETSSTSSSSAYESPSTSSGTAATAQPSIPPSDSFSTNVSYELSRDGNTEIGDLIPNGFEKAVATNIATVDDHYSLVCNTKSSRLKAIPTLNTHNHVSNFDIQQQHPTTSSCTDNNSVNIDSDPSN